MTRMTTQQQDFTSRRLT